MQAFLCALGPGKAIRVRKWAEGKIRTRVRYSDLWLKAYPHYKPDSIPIQSGSIETGSKLDSVPHDSIHIDRVRTIVGSKQRRAPRFPVRCKRERQQGQLGGRDCNRAHSNELSGIT